MNAVVRENSTSLENFWMPFTANRRFKKKPFLLTSAKGMYYKTADGQDILDGTAGLWCVNAGHGRPEIADAVEQQLRNLDYAPTFQLGHPLAFDFAEKLTKLVNPALDRVFFTNSGSESVDTALKIALAYHRANGQPTRTRLIGRERGYHGVGFGGISVGGILSNRRAFLELPGTDHIRHTHNLKQNAFSQGLPKHGAELADDLEGLVQLHGAETIAAVIVEPVAASTGVLLPPVGYLQRLRDICNKHGILLIFDEVITGFGRLGTPFASDFFGIVPDIATTAKGLTNGAIPMGAVFTKRAIYDGLMKGPEEQIEFFHGYTYSGHPAACAAGLATLEIYIKDGLLTRASTIAEKWQSTLHSLKSSPHVIDIRAIGLVAGIELSSREGQPGARAFEVFQNCFENGLVVRFTGDILALSPPLIIQENEIDRIVATISSALKHVP